MPVDFSLPFFDNPIALVLADAFDSRLNGKHGAGYAGQRVLPPQR